MTAETPHPFGLERHRFDRRLARLRTLRERAIDGPPMTAVERAQALYELRRARALFFGSDADLFAEPAWDMLLDLFIARGRGHNLSISDTCVGAEVPPTTGLRWIGLLETRGLVERVRDSHDGRRCFLRLTPSGYETMRLYLEAC